MKKQQARTEAYETSDVSVPRLVGLIIIAMTLLFSLI